MKEKIPPHDIKAEMALLGSMMIDKEATEIGIEKMGEFDFYENSNAKIFSTIKSVHSKNVNVDLITISDALNKIGLSDMVGGTQYLLEIIDSVATSANIEHYCQIVKEKSILRQNISVANRLILRCYENEDSEAIINNVRKEYETLFNIKEKAEANLVMATGDEYFYEYQDVLEKRRELFKDGAELPSGFRDLDEILKIGFMRGQVTTIGARPSVGKTAIGINLIWKFLKKKKRTLLFTTEMTRHNIMDRSLSCEMGLNSYNLMMGRVDENTGKKMDEFREKFKDTELYICDMPQPNIKDIEDMIVKVKPDVYIYDFFNRTYTGNLDKKAIELNNIINRMQTLALENNCAAIVLAQLNREIEKRKSPEPFLSDLKDTGGLEEASALVICMTRDVPDSDDEATQMFHQGTTKIKLWILKNRFGEIGEVVLNYLGSKSRFEDMPRKF